MYSIVYKLYFHLKRVQKSYKEKNMEFKGINKKLLDYSEWFYNVPVKRYYEKFPSKNYGLNTKERKERIVISLTTFPKRINSLWVTIETLLRQTMKPDEIILWIADSQFTDIDSLPANLLNQQKRGLTIRFCDDIKSHKKYFYAMQEYPNDLLILVDDDSFFPYDMVKTLYKLHQQYPDEIISSTMAVVDDLLSVPTYWGRLNTKDKMQHSLRIQPFTGQGTLYPPYCMDEKYLFNKELIMSLCPYADDLWLFYMALRKRTKVCTVYKERSMPVEIYGMSASGLWHINGKDRQNDIQWQAILDYFHEDFSEINE